MKTKIQQWTIFKNSYFWKGSFYSFDLFVSLKTIAACMCFKWEILMLVNKSEHVQMSASYVRILPCRIVKYIKTKLMIFKNLIISFVRSHQKNNQLQTNVGKENTERNLWKLKLLWPGWVKQNESTQHSRKHERHIL